MHKTRDPLPEPRSPPERTRHAPALASSAALFASMLSTLPGANGGCSTRCRARPGCWVALLGCAALQRRGRDTACGARGARTEVQAAALCVIPARMESQVPMCTLRTGLHTAACTLHMALHVGSHVPRHALRVGSRVPTRMWHMGLRAPTCKLHKELRTLHMGLNVAKCAQRMKAHVCAHGIAYTNMHVSHRIACTCHMGLHTPTSMLHKKLHAAHGIEYCKVHAAHVPRCTLHLGSHVPTCMLHMGLHTTPHGNHTHQHAYCPLHMGLHTPTRTLPMGSCTLRCTLHTITGTNVHTGLHVPTRTLHAWECKWDNIPWHTLHVGLHKPTRMVHMGMHKVHNA